MKEEETFERFQSVFIISTRKYCKIFKKASKGFLIKCQVNKRVKKFTENLCTAHMKSMYNYRVYSSLTCPFTNRDQDDSNCNAPDIILIPGKLWILGRCLNGHTSTFTGRLFWGLTKTTRDLKG